MSNKKLIYPIGTLFPTLNINNTNILAYFSKNNSDLTLA